MAVVGNNACVYILKKRRNSIFQVFTIFCVKSWMRHQTSKILLKNMFLLWRAFYMKLKAAKSNVTISERAKTAKPYTKEECRDYDKEKDPARILATMEQYLKKSQM